jgi:hypothetical protein
MHPPVLCRVDPAGLAVEALAPSSLALPHRRFSCRRRGTGKRRRAGKFVDRRRRRVWIGMTTGRHRLIPPIDRPWRVFLSHTSELREHPARRSFVAAAEAAVVRAGHAVSDMAYFAARDAGCVEHCAEMIGRSDVYVGIVGVRYGSPVRNRPERSYTELEYEIATERRIPRLVFLISGDAPSLPPVRQSCERCARQAAFRERLRASGLMVARVRWPADLELELLHALGELRADCLARAMAAAYAG